MSTNLIRILITRRDGEVSKFISDRGKIRAGRSGNATVASPTCGTRRSSGTNLQEFYRPQHEAIFDKLGQPLFIDVVEDIVNTA